MYASFKAKCICDRNDQPVKLFLNELKKKMALARRAPHFLKNIEVTWKFLFSACFVGNCSLQPICAFLSRARRQRQAKRLIWVMVCHSHCHRPVGGWLICLFQVSSNITNLKFHTHGLACSCAWLRRWKVPLFVDITFWQFSALFCPIKGGHCLRGIAQAMFCETLDHWPFSFSTYVQVPRVVKTFFFLL